MPFDPTKTYIADRATLQSWADDGDRDAATWLTKYPEATGFGIDDGGIHAWFITAKQGRAWLAEMRADSDWRDSERRRSR